MRKALNVLVVVNRTNDSMNLRDYPGSKTKNSFVNQVTNAFFAGVEAEKVFSSGSIDREVEKESGEGEASNATSSPSPSSAPQFKKPAHLELNFRQVRFAHRDPFPPVEELVQTTDAIVMSGSKLMVTDNDPWTVELMAWLREVVKHNEEGQGSNGVGRHKPVPILGICFGHQVLCQALGGKVDYNPKGRSYGTYTVNLRPETAKEKREDPVFGSLPDSFEVQVVHSQIISELPPPCSPVVPPMSFYSNEKNRQLNDAYQAVRFGRYTYGVQFHPEYSCQYIKELLGPGSCDPNQDAVPTPIAPRVMSNFFFWCAALKEEAGRNMKEPHL